ncbi:disease resistance protein Pik-2-like [Lolium rigidum]|uniref:disease resistance protein Pik-2-like n=1 Tax=Lolium rigidum TaxID=89674 RepID=UPI001F5C3001|nr:disease resistance protein Pik-2-like [Lolium rigidum]
MEFVVGASEATMKSLLGKLGGLLAQEYTLIRGVRSDVQYISDELRTVQAFLGDIGSAPEGHDRRLKDWMKQIRDMGYDMEDCIDNFAHRLPSDSLSDATCSFLVMRFYELRTFWPRHQIASKISDLKVRAQQIAERRVRYGLDNPAPTKGNVTSSGTGSIGEHLPAIRQLIHTKEPVGAVEDMKKLREWLTKHNGPERHRSVLSLVGFGGVGKTTIATALYREFRNEFDCWASVTISQNYDEDEILRNILHQIKTPDILGQSKLQDMEQEQQGRKSSPERKKNIAADIGSAISQFVPLICGLSKQVTGSSSDFTKNKIETLDHDQLIQVLQTRLTEKRYLLLIDDVWSAETWDKIRIWLPYDNTKDSRVIVTTRFQAVGTACSDREGTDLLHTVNVLNPADSRSLFDQSVSKAQCSDGRETVVGLPCSNDMSTDTHITVDKHTDDSINPLDHSVFEFKNNNVRENKEVVGKVWEHCGGLPLAIVTMAGLVSCNPEQNDVYWSRIFQDFFPEKVAPLTLDGVTRILDYCYNNLPPELRTCSLYLSIFPKGMTISRKRLTRRWISECFVTEKQGLTAEEVAETYFNQLISRKIIRPVDHSSNGKVKSFKVHDMILEYIVSKSSEENFITVVGGHWLMPAPTYKVRRLSMQSSGSKHGSSTKGMNLSQVRSLTAFGSKNQRLPFHSFNNGIIQVLDLEGWKGLEQKHLSDICRMVVLKYLSLRRTEVREIPSQIEKLEYLETLDIRETNVAALPKSFGRLKLLRSMLGGSKYPRKTLKLPQGINNEPMKGLRILSGIEITEESVAAVASLHQLTGLRKLGIYKLNIEEGSKTFKQLVSSIEYLCSCGLQTLVINDERSEFINSLDSMSAPPRYLIALELSGKMEKPPKWIENLSNLYKLTLSVTVLRTDTFQLIQKLPKLFCLTFTLSAAREDQDIVDILEENKQLTDREIIVPPGGFENLKLLRFFATLVPRISFAVKENKKVMPALERIDMRFLAFEGIYGIETLEKLQEVHLSVDSQADDITKLLVDDLKDAHKHIDKESTYKCPKIITG